MRIIRISIRTQLICLVSFVTVLSLLVLAITTGLKNTRYILSIQGEQLQIVSMLKAAQLAQAIQLIYYQVHWVSQHESIRESLNRYKSGKYSTSNWDDAISNIQNVLDSTGVLLGAQMYDADFESICNVTKNSSISISQGFWTDNSFLYPLSPQLKNDSVVLAKLNSRQGYVAGPVRNQTVDSDIDDYLMSFTIPVFAGVSIMSQTPIGFLTVAAKATSLYSVMNNELDENHFMLLANIQDYKLVGSKKWASPYELLDNVSKSPTNITYYNSYSEMLRSQPDRKQSVISDNLTDTKADFVFLFPDHNTNLDTSAQVIYPLESFPTYHRAIKTLNSSNSGYMLKTHTPFNRPVSTAFTTVNLNYVNWVVIVEEKHSETFTPIDHLTQIHVATILPLAAFIITATYFLGHFIVRPINRLVNAAAQTKLYGKNYKYLPPKPKHLFPFLKDISKVLWAWKRSPTDNEYLNDSNHLSSSINQSSRNNVRLESENDIKNSISNIGISDEADGDSDYIGYFHIPSHIERPHTLITDELTTLTDTFNLMTNELQKQYSHLEECVRDRTRDLELAKTAADNANEAKTLFIANITHELRTPLNGILGMTAVSMNEDNPNKLRRSLKVIFKSGELLLHLLTDLLTFSKNQVGRMTLDEKEFTMPIIYSQLRAIFSKQARDKNVDFTLSVQPYQKIVNMVLFGDSNRILQIIINMTSNALKFTPVGGKVDIGIKLRGEFDPIATAGNGNEKLCVKRRRKKRCSSRNSNSLSVADTRSTGFRTKSSSFSSNAANSTMDSNSASIIANTNSGGGDSKPELPATTRANINSSSSTGYPPSVESSSTHSYSYAYNISQSIGDIDEDGSLSYDCDDNNSFGCFSDFDYPDDDYEALNATTYEDNETILSAEQNNLIYTNRDPHTGIVESHYSGRNTRNTKMVLHLGRDVTSDDLLDNEHMPPSQQSKEENDGGELQGSESMGANSPTSSPSAVKKYNQRSSILIPPPLTPLLTRGQIPIQPSVTSSSAGTKEATSGSGLGSSSGFMKPRTMVFEITVTDDGPGIAPHLHERVFEPFVQGEQALSRKHGGTGLGLSICRQLATMMGGFMDLESEVGEGSVFTLQIPLKWSGVMPLQDDLATLTDNQKTLVPTNSSSLSMANCFNNNNIWPKIHPDISDSLTANNENSFQITRPQFSDDDDEEDEGDIALPTKDGFNSHFRPIGDTLTDEKNNNSALTNEKIDHSQNESLTQPADTKLISLLQKPNILVAEDNSINQLVIKRMLHLEGITNVKFVENGEMALQQIKTVMNMAKESSNLNSAQDPVYDLVFMDMQMPVMGGIKATQLIRNKLGYKRPIISLTAFGQDENYIERCMNAGMNDYLTKPIKREALGALLAKWLNQSPG
ncbi:hypothetical protein NADFUDRAFT_43709 [Nadsonia fulvescens var. elongata DSM 6958]|uniref:histidine kinase n=1 Tax=Nadsonia fulvescens var. elongata DSM 6958 TaxID=857566 RepID=A0A1E3PF83_9ASCO|nr:hypothetical protein NADFUDRAFT_43709 [Nadsonia fulvescens var. elongata DSM 6958]